MKFVHHWNIFQLYTTGFLPFVWHEHQGQCGVGNKVCYLCGLPGHIKRFCPTLPQGDSFTLGTTSQYQSHFRPAQGQRDV